MANALSSVQLDSVAPADTVDFSVATKFSLLTADGLQVLAELTEVEEQWWLRISASAYEPDDADDIDAVGASGSDAEVMDEDASASDVIIADAGENNEPEVEASQRAAEINQRASGWAYAIPSFKADAMNKRMEDLLKASPDKQ